MGWLPRPSAPAMATLATPVTEGGRDWAVKGGPSFSEFWFLLLVSQGPVFVLLLQLKRVIYPAGIHASFYRFPLFLYV